MQNAAAARELGRSRAQVNRLVIALEDQRGVQLWNRTTHSLSLTPSGDSYYQHRRPLLSLVPACEEDEQVHFAKRFADWLALDTRWRRQLNGRETLFITPMIGQDDDMRLTLFDATNPQLDWYVVNDGVMGGQSEGDYCLDAGSLVFTGVTNTNGGGFSSIRTRPKKLGLNAQRHIVLHARGDGRRYVCRLEDNRSTAYWADFEPPTNAWAEVLIEFAAFRPRFRGRWLEGPQLDPARVTMLGLMCYDGGDGPFRLETDRIEAV